MDAITHQAVVEVVNNFYYVYSKWESGKITRQLNQRTREGISLGYSKIIENAPSDIKWIDVRKK